MSSDGPEAYDDLPGIDDLYRGFRVGGIAHYHRHVIDESGDRVVVLVTDIFPMPLEPGDEIDYDNDEPAFTLVETVAQGVFHNNQMVQSIIAAMACAQLSGDRPPGLNIDPDLN